MGFYGDFMELYGVFNMTQSMFFRKNVNHCGSPVRTTRDDHLNPRAARRNSEKTKELRLERVNKPPAREAGELLINGLVLLGQSTPETHGFLPSN